MASRFRLLPPGMQIGWMPYAWLVYAIPFFIDPLQRRFTAMQVAITAVSFVVFLALYFRAYWIDGRGLVAIIATMVALGAINAPFNAGAIAFYLFAACFIGWIGLSRFNYLVLLGYVAVIAALVWAEHLPESVAVIAIVLSALLGALNIRQAEMNRANADLRQARAEVERLATVAERERIARDLHDVLGHTLSVIVLKSELAARLADVDTARATHEIRDVERIAREALRDVREAVSGYRALALGAEVTRVRDVLATAGVAVACSTDSVPLTPSQESVLALALREGVTNVVRHAKATRCDVNLIHAGDACRLEIHDDGNGGTAAEGSGLRGMRERIEALGGTFARTVSSGTHLVLTLPLGAEQR